MTEGHGPTWSNGVGRSDAVPLGRSDAERGVGHAGVLPAPARHRGARRGVWAGAGVARGVRGVDPHWWWTGCCRAPRGLGAATRQGERDHISRRTMVLVSLLETPQGNKTEPQRTPCGSFRPVLFIPNAPQYFQRTAFNM